MKALIDFDIFLSSVSMRTKIDKNMAPNPGKISFYFNFNGCSVWLIIQCVKICNKCIILIEMLSAFKKKRRKLIQNTNIQWLTSIYPFTQLEI